MQHDEGLERCERPRSDIDQTKELSVRWIVVVSMEITELSSNASLHQLQSCCEHGLNSWCQLSTHMSVNDDPKPVKGSELVIGTHLDFQGSRQTLMTQ